MASLPRSEVPARPSPLQDISTTPTGTSSVPPQPMLLNPALSSLLRRPSAPPGQSPPKSASANLLPSSTPNAGSALNAGSGPTNDDIEAVIKMAMANSASRAAGPQRDTRTQLFVGNLPYRVRWQDLKDLFRRAGTVLRADVSLGPDNRSRGFGTVLLASAEDAGRAVDMFNGYCWQTRTLEVRPDRMEDHSGSGAGTPSIHGATPLPTGAAAAALAGLHAPAPLARFASAPAAVYSGLLGGEEAGAALSRPGTGSGGVPALGASRNLFVGNLPFHIQWQDLKDLFRQAGAVQRADVALGADGRSRGFGTVSFANEADAERAVRMFNGFEYNGRALKVHYDKFSAPASTALPAASAPNTPTALALAHAHAQAQAQAHAHAFPHSLAHAASFAQHVLQQQHEQRLQQEQTVAQLLSASLRQNGGMDAGNSLADGFAAGNRGAEENPPVSFSLDPETISSHSPLSQHHPRPQHLDLSQHQAHHHTPPSHIPMPYHSPYTFDFLHSGPNSPYEFYGSSMGYMPQYALDHSRYYAELRQPEQPDAAAPENVASPTTSTRTAAATGTAAPAASLAQGQSVAPASSSPAESQPPNQATTALSSPTGSQRQAAPQSNGTQSHTPHQHPAHPGPIALPPPPPVTAFPVPPPHTLSPVAYQFSPIMQTPISPLHPPPHMVGTPYGVAFTPHGLPPVTPSMPSFTFVPQQTPGGEPAHNVPLPAFDPTRVIPPHLLSPYTPFSPGVTMSPWCILGPPRSPGEPAPTADGQQQPPPWGGAAAFYAYARGRGHAQGAQDEYFPPVPVSMAMAQGSAPADDQARDAGYFPPIPPASASRSSGLANEIARDGASNSGSSSAEQGADVSASPESRRPESGASTGGTRTTESVGTGTDAQTSPSSHRTSWHESDAPGLLKQAALELAQGLEALVLDGETDSAGKQLHPRTQSDKVTGNVSVVSGDPLQSNGVAQLPTQLQRADSDPVRSAGGDDTISRS
ncbi:hypothetical protein CERSUDRAFT_124727 [Gelatoporia subvermispora B]|uniref:RRM domain-containing protein n=1 Tax=Ceriporiopsis subvermispora (strain B) TaxID=914234 RepID=M2R9I0_CERS8|nr:hypothetical protein CERSUDRAFT_124727 [Gelatoporia subvermispora B]